MSLRKGQSLLELCAVITMVAIGVFFAGPTIVRGINAHFKLWDDSIQDSYNDPMKQAAPLINGELPTTCTCSDWQGTPAQQCGVSPCHSNEHLETRFCNPVGCGQALAGGCTSSAGVRCISGVERCVDDPSCCNIFTDTERCGEGTSDAGDCPLGQRVTQAGCGGSETRFGCRQDWEGPEKDGNPSCVPKCMGQYVMNETETPSTGLPVLCSGDDTGFPPNSTFVQDSSGIGIPIKMLGTGFEKCTTTRKCEVYCPAGYKRAGLSCIPANCQPAAQTFQLGAINEQNTHHRILGDWDSCTLVRCNINGVPSSSNCILEKTATTQVLADSVLPSQCTSCWAPAANCLQSTGCFSSRTVQVGQWLLTMNLGLGEKINSPGDVEISCDRSPAKFQKFLIHICDDDFYGPIASQMSPGGKCFQPSDNGGIVCDTTGAIIATGDTGETCPNLNWAQVPVKGGDTLTLYETDRGAGMVSFYPGPGCTSATATSIWDSGQSMTVPCDGYVTNTEYDDNVATVLTRKIPDCCPWGLPSNKLFLPNGEGTMHHVINEYYTPDPTTSNVFFINWSEYHNNGQHLDQLTAANYWGNIIYDPLNNPVVPGNTYTIEKITGRGEIFFRSGYATNPEALIIGISDNEGGVDGYMFNLKDSDGNVVFTFGNTAAPQVDDYLEIVFTNHQCGCPPNLFNKASCPAGYYFKESCPAGYYKNTVN